MYSIGKLCGVYCHSVPIVIVIASAESSSCIVSLSPTRQVSRNRPQREGLDFADLVVLEDNLAILALLADLTNWKKFKWHEI